MPLIGLAITAACQNVYSNHQDACSKFLEAGARSSQLYQGDEKVENYFTLEAKDMAGKPAEEAAAGSYYFYKVYKNRAIDFKIPTMGLADRVTAHVEQSSGSLGFNWKFPW